MSEPTGRWLRWGFLLVALLDAIATVALFPAPQGGLRVRLLQLGFACGHVVLLGFILGALSDAGRKLLPARWFVAPLAAWLVGIALGFGIFIDDFAVFGLPIRIGLVIASALPFALLVLLRERVLHNRWLSIAALVLGIAATGVNPVALDANYAGIHLATTITAGVLAGLGLQGLRLPSVSLGSERARRVAAIVGWALAAFWAAGSVAIWPSNQVLVALSRQPTASLVPFLARMRHFAAEKGTAQIPIQQLEWYADRSKLAPIPPTRPALYSGKPLVVFITIDAFRADMVSDKKQKATTNLKELAKQGAYFTQARSTASATSPAISSLFSGMYYSSLYWTEQELDGKLKQFLSEETTVRWPELLGPLGVHRIAIPGTDGFLPQFGLLRGIDEYTAELGSSNRVVDAIKQKLDEVDDRPTLIYAHILDPHAPYSRGKKSDKPKARYAAEVDFVDEQLKRLWDSIEEKGLKDRTTFIVSADHGEAFGEHGTKYHYTTVYEELVRIPMIVVGPGIKPRVINEPVSLIDLGPTILDIFGADTPGHFMGQSLVPLLAGKNVELTRPIVLDTGRRKQGIVFRDNMKVIRNVREGTYELYDLKADPKELVNLVDDRPEEARQRLALLEAFFDVHELKKPGYTIPYRN